MERCPACRQTPHFGMWFETRFANGFNKLFAFFEWVTRVHD